MKNNLIAFGFVLIALTYFPGDVWRSKIFVGLLFSSHALWWKIRKIVHPSAALAWLFSVLACMQVFGFPTNPYRHLNPLAQLSLENQAYESVFFILMITIPFLFSTREQRENLRKGIVWVCALDSLFVIAQALMGYSPEHRGGFFGNPSINACFIAVTMALGDTSYFEWIYSWLPARIKTAVGPSTDTVISFLPLVAVFLSHSSMAIGCIAVVFTAFLFGYCRYKTAIAGTALVWAVILGVAYFLIGGHEIFNDSDRFGVWKIAMQWWWTHAPHLDGTGQGTAFLLVPDIQIRNNLHLGNWWLWLHNDWLQVLFEQGYFGLFAYLWLFIAAVVRCIKRDNTELLAAVCGFAFMALGNYPCRLMAHSLVFVSLVSLVFMDGSETHG